MDRKRNATTSKPTRRLRHSFRLPLEKGEGSADMSFHFCLVGSVGPVSFRECNMSFHFCLVGSVGPTNHCRSSDHVCLMPWGDGSKEDSPLWLEDPPFLQCKCTTKHGDVPISLAINCQKVPFPSIPIDFKKTEPAPSSPTPHTETSFNC